jgi:hypothetical protein
MMLFEEPQKDGLGHFVALSRHGGPGWVGVGWSVTLAGDRVQ